MDVVRLPSLALIPSAGFVDVGPPSLPIAQLHPAGHSLRVSRNQAVTSPAMLLAQGLDLDTAIDGRWFAGPLLQDKLDLVLMPSVIRRVQIAALGRSVDKVGGSEANVGWPILDDPLGAAMLDVVETGCSGSRSSCALTGHIRA